MDDYTALVRAVCTDPADDTPRLVLADWLDENGQPDRGEFVRTQVRIATLGRDCSCFKCFELRGGGQRHTVPCAVDRADPTLRRRERDLLAAHWLDWLGFDSGRGPGSCVCCTNLGVYAPAAVDVIVTFRRGFVAYVHPTVPEYERSAATIFAGTPVEAVTLGDCAPGQAPAWMTSRGSYARDYGWYYWSRGGPPPRAGHVVRYRERAYYRETAAVPAAVFDFLPGGRTLPDEPALKFYPAWSSARDALDRAALACGRVAAGLPPLPAAEKIA